LFKKMLNLSYDVIYPARTEDEYLHAQEDVEVHGADDASARNKIR